MDAVKIQLSERFFLLKPWKNWLAQPLTCLRNEVEMVRGRPKYRHIAEALYTLQGSSAVIFSGLFERTVALLRKNKAIVSIEDLRAPLPEPDFSLLQGSLKPNQDQILAAIFSSYNGMIVAPTGFGKSHLIEQICRMYNIKILVVTQKRDLLKSLYVRIAATVKDLGKKVLEVRAGKCFHKEADIIVCSAGSLHHIDRDWPDLLLFDEVHRSAAPQVSTVLAGFNKCRAFGFTASPTGRGDKAELLMEALFGEVICNISYAEAQGNSSVAPIRVYMKSVGGAYVKRTFPIARLRNNIWRSYTRNNEIAEIAAMLRDEQVLVLVDKVEHALYLKQYLPDYEVVHSGIDAERRLEFISQGVLRAEDPLVVDIADCRERFKAGTLRKVIATGVWAEGIDFPNLTFLIRADAGNGEIPSIQMGGRLSRVSGGKVSGCLFDFQDGFHPSFLRRSQNRIRAYRKQGWIVSDYRDFDLAEFKRS